VSGCFDRPRWANSKHNETEKDILLSNWVISALTGDSRADDALIDAGLVAMLRSGRYRNERTGTELTFILPRDLNLRRVAKARPGLFEVFSLPISAMASAYISLSGLFIAVGLTAFILFRVPILVASGAQGQMFYLLLIPFAVSSAAFLFGVTRGFLTIGHRQSLAQRGGPVILFCLIMIGGFKLVSQATETFDLSVRVHSLDAWLITSGQVTLDLPGSPAEPIGSDGEAHFNGLSTKLIGKPIRVLVKVDGYEEKWLSPRVDGNVFTVELERTFVQKALLVPPPPKVKNTKVIVHFDGQEIETVPDEVGRFTFCR
jgi:hypothetical protein